MKPRNRDINIFNLSMLDVICGSLGAFILLMIILLPYYKKSSIDYQQEIHQLEQQRNVARQETDSALARASIAEAASQAAQAELEQVRHQIQAAQDRMQAEQQEIKRLQKDVQRTQELENLLESTRKATQDAEKRARRAEQMLAKTFLVIYIRWNTLNQDVDLHVIDPTGAEFYFKQKTVSSRPGELSEDSQIGPGNEVWEIKDAPAGRYQIFANLFARHGNTSNPTVKGRIFFRDGSKLIPEILLTDEKIKKSVGVITVKDDGTVEFSW
ncbi:YfaP family protein [Desulfatirhabdium butyrativorans]|uniref:YfaP family protein n=1 Tax=Desulfatirhabdium butyrativorans TaxID=340467 RepID=UPI000426DC8C|nr:hypothetical protein [Desulfatirhabdium butyrativorans]